MNVKIMANIDNYVGSSLCYLFSFFRKFVPTYKKSNKIVVGKFFGLGSQLLMLPTLEFLKDQGLDIYILTFQNNKDFWKFLGFSHERLILIRSEFRYFWKDTFKAFIKLRKIQPSYFINFEFFSRYVTLLGFFSGAYCRAGFYHPSIPTGKLLTHKLHLNPYLHISENFINLAKILLSKNLNSSFDINKYLQTKRLNINNETFREKYIIVNIETEKIAWHLRNWPFEYWKDLISKILNSKHFKKHSIFLIGTKKISFLAEELKSSFDSKLIKNFCGKTNFEEFLSLLKNADLIITLDSAPLHFGAFLGRPTLALFGPETPKLYGYHLPYVRIIYKKFPCSPCYDLLNAKKSILNCMDNQCMKSITPEEVYQTIIELKCNDRIFKNS